MSNNDHVVCIVKKIDKTHWLHYWQGFLDLPSFAMGVLILTNCIAPYSITTLHVVLNYRFQTGVLIIRNQRSFYRQLLFIDTPVYFLHYG